ncbi:hypothetical protein COE79_25560 [Bacillus toyonensis]|nr:hypothetical protein COO14_15195 [Bacillus toyonensis]PEL37902.1 hypothetical protein CN623_02075 [Bacillus toyonensis]PEP88873.1 hypothetical protein CN583_25295 [Bacillus toyonensis]PHA97236.1 hypothetical protein COE79_25560 [Bacillus toyonensis]PHC31474.1 hypothetical protein COE95_11625 [Bacillus toyonensis]
MVTLENNYQDIPISVTRKKEPDRKTLEMPPHIDIKYLNDLKTITTRASSNRGKAIKCTL